MQRNGKKLSRAIFYDKKVVITRTDRWACTTTFIYFIGHEAYGSECVVWRGIALATRVHRHFTWSMGRKQEAKKCLLLIEQTP